MEVKKQRLAILQARIDQHTARISDAMLGTDQIILVTHRATKSADEMAGRTENNRMVNFRTLTGQCDNRLIGKMISVRIESANRNFLSGVMS